MLRRHLIRIKIKKSIVIVIQAVDIVADNIHTIEEIMIKAIIQMIIRIIVFKVMLIPENSKLKVQKLILASTFMDIKVASMVIIVLSYMKMSLKGDESLMRRWKE